MMHYTEYSNVQDFLAVVEPYLMQDECVNGLMLGVCLRLIEQPGFDGDAPYLATIASEEGPHIASVRTPPRKNLLIYAESPENPAGVDAFVDGLLKRSPGEFFVAAVNPVAEAFTSAWCRKTGATSRVRVHTRIHRLDAVVHPAYPPGDVRVATEKDLDLVREWACGFQRDCFHEPPDDRTYSDAEKRVADGSLFLWVDGTSRAMAARSRPTPNGECINYVYTPPEHRNHGYASAVVARLSQKILDEGKSFCTLFTDLSNPTSNRIYRKIGYVGVADFLDVQLEVK